MQSSMDSEFLLPELDSDPEGPFIPCCLFCCGNLRLKNYGIRSQDSKLGLFCQAFNLTEEPFERGLQMSPLCPNCVALIERIGGMLERIQELELKLKLEKETFLELLRQDFPDQPSSSSSSPLQFRGEIQKKLNISPNIGTCPPKNEGKITESGLDKSDETDNSFDLEDEPLNSAEDQVDEVDMDCKFTSSLDDNSNYGEVSRIFEEDPLLKVGDAEVKLERSEETGVKYTLPTGIVLKDCTVQLERGRKAELGAEKILREQSLKKDSGKAGVVPKHPAKRRIRKKKIIPEAEDPKKPIPCKYIGFREKCFQFFPDEESMIVHIRKVHGKGCDCEICGVSLENTTKLLRHKVHVHGEPPPFVCTEEGCGKRFITSNALKAHGYSHTGEYPYRCEICGLGIGFLSRLKEHLNVHLDKDAKNFVCDVCGKTFKSRTLVKTHRKYHEKDRRHKCSLCDKAFKTPLSLQTHINFLHSDERPHLCSECGASFKVKQHLDRHVKNHEGVVKRKFGIRRRVIKPSPSVHPPGVSPETKNPRPTAPESSSLSSLIPDKEVPS